jgi:hypothetical protein
MNGIIVTVAFALGQVPPVIVTPRRDGPMCLIEQPVGRDYRESLLAAHPTEYEVHILSRALWGCSRGAWRVADLDDALALLRHEVELGVPDELRGLLLAVWCVESGMRVEARAGGPIRGDWRGTVAMAHGPFQLWPWHRDWCGLDDGEVDDLLDASWCYWRRVVDRRRERAMECSDSWKVGEALAANGPRYLSAGCAAESGHWREWQAWGLATPAQAVP